MQKARWVVTLIGLSALSALVCVSAVSGTSATRGYAEVYLDDFPSAFVLDQPAPVTIKVHNASKIIMRHGQVAIAAETDVFAGGTCTKFVTDQGAAACKWRISYIRPGRTVAFKLMLNFSSRDYPGAFDPGTTSHQVVLEMQADAAKLQSGTNRALLTLKAE